MVDGFFLDAMGPLAEIFPLRHQLDGLRALAQGMMGGRLKGVAKALVGHILRGKDLELTGRTIHGVSLRGSLPTDLPNEAV